MIEVTILAVALAMDVMVVAASAAANGIDRGAGLRMPLVFGAFHLVMASIGCGLGEVADAWFGAWDHYVVFGVLVAVGGKMLHSAFAPAPTEPSSHSWLVIFALGFVTSVDAIAAGVSLPSLTPPRLVSIAMIAGVATVLTFVGFHAGARLGRRSRILQIIGALALIAIGTKTLIAHLTT